MCVYVISEPLLTVHRVSPRLTKLIVLGCEFILKINYTLLIFQVCKIETQARNHLLLLRRWLGELVLVRLLEDVWRGHTRQVELEVRSSTNCWLALSWLLLLGCLNCWL